MELVFATNNNHKLDEIKNAIQHQIRILSLKDIGCLEDIEETAETLEGNASIKSSYVFKTYNLNCFADDTGLEIDFLDGKPGVYSARYGGPGHDHLRNMDRVLKELQGVNNRKARFRTVISLILDGQEYFFEGIVNGVILNEKHGTKGFGYDPIFQPDGYDISFAEMDLETKNSISHRGKAVQQLVSFLGTYERP